MDEDIAKEIQRARQATQQRDRKTARAILRKVLKRQPRNLEAWLLFAEVAKKDEQTVHCLEQVLKIDPENEIARQRLASLYSPSHSYLARVQMKSTADPLQVLHQLREEFDSQSSYQQEFEEDDPEGNGASSLPGNITHADLVSAKNHTRSAITKHRGKATLSEGEIASLAAITILFLSLVAGLGFIIFGGSSHFRTKVAETGAQAQAASEDYPSVLYRYIQALNTEDLSAYQATIHPDCPARRDTREIERSFQTYDLSYELLDVDVLDKSEQEVRLSFVQVTRRLGGPEFRDNQSTGVAILRPDHGVWKIYEQQIEAIVYLK